MGISGGPYVGFEATHRKNRPLSPAPRTGRSASQRAAADTIDSISPAASKFLDDLRRVGKLHAVPVDWRPEFMAFEFEIGDSRATISVLDGPLDRLLRDKTPFLPERRLAEEAKGPMVVVIDTSKLELGDIVLSTTTHIDSRIIRWATRAPVSHAAIHVGGGFLIEAVDEGVRKAHVRSFIFPNERFVRILRPMRVRAATAIDRATRVARKLVYRPYSTWNAIASVVPVLHRQSEFGRFCSQVVAESYAAAGMPLVNVLPSAVTPAMLLKSTVEDLLAERGLDISYETVRSWVHNTFNPSTSALGALSSIASLIR
jgi:hypothetical protein